MKYLFPVLILILTFNLQSKEKDYYFGFDAGYSFTNFNAQFDDFNGIETCGIYEHGTGNGLYGSIYGEYKISDPIIAGLNFGFIQKNGNLPKMDTAHVRNLSTGSVDTVNTENTLSVDLSYFEIAPYIKLIVDENFINGPFSIFLTPTISFPVTSNFDQRERIANPENVFFDVDGQRLIEREVASGEMTTITSPQFSLGFGVFNEMKVGDNLYFTQRIQLNQDFQDILNDAEFKALTFRAGLGLKFAFPVEKKVTPPPQEPIMPRELPPPPKPGIEITTNFDFDNSYIETEEELVAEVPLINSVYFDKNSSDIPGDYILREISDSYTLEEPIKAHYFVLPRIKNIIAENPNSEIIVKGYTAGRNEENNPLQLAQQRAEAVKQAFIDLGVPENKLSIEYKVDPDIKVNPDYEEGLAENRRVDIELKNVKQQRFVVKKFASKLYGKAEFNVNTEHLDKEYKFTSDIADTRTLKGDNTFDTQFNEELELDQNSFEYTAAVKNDIVKDSVSNFVPLDKLEEQKTELQTDNFEAVLLFDFASSELKDENKALLEQLVELVPTGKTIQLIGNSDKIGLEDVNIKLAEERADKSIEYIKNSTNKNLKFEKLTNTDKFDEDTPQGRVLNRSIIIRIK